MCLHPYHVLHGKPNSFWFLWIWSGSNLNSSLTSKLASIWLYLSHIKQTQHTQLILLKAKINFLICSVPSTRLTYHVCLLYHLKKMKCSSDTELSKYKGKILSCPQKCPEENLNYEINLVLYRHSAICFLLCIKYSWPSVIDKEPISFYLSSVLKREEMGTEGKLC